MVAAEQLLALGVSRGAIKHQVAKRRLLRVHQGVYAVGHEALTDRSRMVAALLAAGPGAALSHRTAAYLWKLLPSMPQCVETTLTDRAPRARPGLVVHRARTLETTRHDGLLTTTPLATIGQLRGTEADRARAEALVLRLIPRTADDHAEPTRSEMERALLRTLERAGLPRPLVNAVLLGHEVDFHWPEHRLVVETDGWAAHRSRRAFERDRARDAELQAAGYRVIRFTWRQIRDETVKVVVQIARALSLPAPPACQALDDHRSEAR